MLDDSLRLYAPEFLLEEYEKYAPELFERSQRTREELEHLFELLKRRIQFVRTEEIRPFLPQALEISPDPKDAAYVALAICLGTAIWSNDKHLRNQNHVRVWATHDLLKLV